MLDNFTPTTFALTVFIILSIRYYAITGLLYYLFWVKKVNFLTKHPIHARNIKPRPTFEMYYSFLTCLVNTALAYIIFYLYQAGYLKIYEDINQHSIMYFLFSIIAAIFFHDTYFYWAHRSMHSPWLYKKVHAIHHRSINPTPFATHSFHPIEAVMESLFLLPMFAILPMHVYAIVIFLLLTFIFNVAGHLGYEILPTGVWNKWWGRWLTTTTHHNIHHQYFKGNYALYGRYWDVWFGTLHPKTAEEFYRVKSQK